MLNLTLKFRNEAQSLCALFCFCYDYGRITPPFGGIL